MRYRLMTARVLVASYGDQFTPDTGHLPHVYGEELDRAIAGTVPGGPGTGGIPEPAKGKVTAALENAVKTWLSQDYPIDPNDPETRRDAAEQALREAQDYVVTAMEAMDPGHEYEIYDDVPAYRPIFDDKGNVVGHDVITWLHRDGVQMEHTVPTSPSLTLFGCVILVIAEL